MDIRDRLRELLRERHINCSSLAKATGINKQILYDCFGHRRRLEASEFIRICIAVGFSIDDFRMCQGLEP